MKFTSAGLSFKQCCKVLLNRTALQFAESANDLLSIMADRNAENEATDCLPSFLTQELVRLRTLNFPKS